MAALLAQIQEQMPLFWVILLRVAGILAAIPAIGSQSVPLRIRVVLVVGLTMVLFPIVSDQIGPLRISLPLVLPLLFTEFMVGIVLGLSIRFLMAAFEIAGELIGVQMGLTLINALDPIAGAQLPILGQFMSVLALLVFFAIDGHHLALGALMSSFQLVQPLHVHLGGPVVNAVLQLGVVMLVLALKVAAPVMSALFLVTFAMGILGRTIPQLNVMLSNLPVTIGVGLLVFGLSLPLFGSLAQTAFSDMGRSFQMLLGVMGQSGKFAQ